VKEIMLKRLARKIFARNVLYYPGCLINFYSKDLNENYLEILKKLGINVVQIPEFICCGSPVLNAGYKTEYEKLREKNLKLFDKYGIGTIITPCPACYKMLSKEYNLAKEGIEVKHITQVLAENLHKIKDIFRKEKNMPEITYHDPCHLGRHCGIYDEPRKVLMAAGFNLKEFKKNKANAECCGAGSGVRANFPETARKVAQKRLKDCKTKILVTTCPLCYLHLKDTADAEKNVDVMELSQLMKDAI
jgi:Fe-S oxidoreductase